MNPLDQETSAMQRARDWTGYSGPLHTLKPEERKAMERAAKLAGKQTWWFEQMKKYKEQKP